LRETARQAEGVGAPDPPRPEAADADLLGAVDAALEAAEKRARRDADASQTIGETSRSLQDLIAKLAALAGHFRYPGAKNAAAPAPVAARLTPPRRLTAS